ncbi:MAG: hypothetical protein M3063_02055 [Actinomycetota bacterium]|nr:hypothetical protein [Actinomycetota bacterium]
MPPSAQAARRRAERQKRRRDVFFALMAGVVGSLILGVIPGLHVMLYIQVLFDLLTAGYVALLVRRRNLAAERELKLSYLPATRRVDPAAVAPVPHAARGSYGNDYDYEFDYGDLAVRRAAN